MDDDKVRCWNCHESVDPLDVLVSGLTGTEFCPKCGAVVGEKKARPVKTAPPVLIEHDFYPLDGSNA
jgi:hypothetical protein